MLAGRKKIASIRRQFFEGDRIRSLHFRDSVRPLPGLLHAHPGRGIGMEISAIWRHFRNDLFLAGFEMAERLTISEYMRQLTKKLSADFSENAV